jgi:hypothetical protein
MNLPSPGFEKWNLYDVYFLNENEGWVVGGSFGKDGPVLFHYTNGAFTIENPAESKNQTLLSVIAPGPDQVIAGGFKEGALGQIAGFSAPNGSYIIQNSDNWAPVKLPMLAKNIICEDLAFVDAENIYAVGWMPAFQAAPNTGKMLFYDGKKWSEVKLDDPAKEWSLAAADFSDVKTGWAVGFLENRKSGLLMEFAKGSWSALGKKSEPVVSEDWILRDVVYDGKGNWYAVGGDYKTDKGVVLLLSK